MRGSKTEADATQAKQDGLNGKSRNCLGGYKIYNYLKLKYKFKKIFC
jgi:hypothetical protein